MKLFLLALAVLGISPSVKAESFKCHFTEPFFTVKYSTDTKKMEQINDIEKKRVVHRNVEFKIESAGVFLLIDQKGKELARLTLSGKGSDGMSENIYPYEVKYALLGGANNGIGACESTMLPIIRKD